jgi:FtsH-binding integral membrane protein
LKNTNKFIYILNQFNYLKNINMDIKNKILQWYSFTNNDVDVDIKIESENIISRTFLWVWIILFITFGVWYFTHINYMSWTWDINNFFVLSIIAMIIWFIIIRRISWAWQKLSYSTLAFLFILFGIIEWFALSWIFFQYNLNAIIQALLSTSIMFITLSIIWYWLKQDVTKFTPILIAGLIALILSSIINMFLNSWTFNLIINIIWLIIFSALTIVDMQWLKKASQIWDRRIEVVMWLSLFLNFINMFLFLLNLFGRWE